MQEKVLPRLRNWISGSGLAKGDRLPPERTLCTTLGVSRAELRNAYLVLEAEGILERHVGRGTFLSRSLRAARGSNGIEGAISELAESTGPVDAMTARLVLEPELANLAALHATPLQLRELRRLASAMREATSWSAYEELDSEFHETIAAASGNTLLQALHRMVNGVRVIVVWRRLKSTERGPGADYHSFDEHDAILAALESRDGPAASAAMRQHLQGTLAAMTAAPPA
ncbi:FadR/GntR family transcriptional regulator [Tropicimonas sediminicola]|uniref:DNA-binding transcriptional regulator, FadR family n=1 Tax=Tropicimonas sediminicola TaxID=1031541 RepID=A0A239HZZ0_9RHOB|nr:FCD domain-containing protein [Tropicimonas sediminicola]SNS86897.1 DNA-binding transcriptional regulator, FadR family [Tropicimonas sediminicola]